MARRVHYFTTMALHAYVTTASQFFASQRSFGYALAQQNLPAARHIRARFAKEVN